MEFFTFVGEQWLLVSVFMVLVFGFAISERNRGGKPVSPRELTQMLNAEQAVLLDVREQKDYKTGHIVGAIHIPISKLKNNIAELNPHKEKLVVVADKVGQHAGMAGRMLRKEGFEVRRLGGGMSEWQNQNLPLAKS